MASLLTKMMAKRTNIFVAGLKTSSIRMKLPDPKQLTSAVLPESEKLLPVSKEILSFRSHPLYHRLKELVEKLPPTQPPVSSVPDVPVSIDEAKSVLDDVPVSAEELKSLFDHFPISVEGLKELLGHVPSSVEELKSLLDILYAMPLAVSTVLIGQKANIACLTMIIQDPSSQQSFYQMFVSAEFEYRMWIMAKKNEKEKSLTTKFLVGLSGDKKILPVISKWVTQLYGFLSFGDISPFVKGFYDFVVWMNSKRIISKVEDIEKVKSYKYGVCVNLIVPELRKENLLVLVVKKEIVVINTTQSGEKTVATTEIPNIWYDSNGVFGCIGSGDQVEVFFPVSKAAKMRPAMFQVRMLSRVIN